MKLSYFSTLGRIGAIFFFFFGVIECSRVLDFDAEKCLLSLYVLYFIDAVGFGKSWVDCPLGKVLLSCLMTTDEEELNMRGRWRQFFASAGWGNYALNRSYKLEINAI